jgi:hypothetical protein
MGAGLRQDGGHVVGGVLALIGADHFVDCADHADLAVVDSDGCLARPREDFVGVGSEN